MAADKKRNALVAFVYSVTMDDPDPNHYLETMGAGRSTGKTKPAMLRKPYPSEAEVERAIGMYDSSAYLCDIPMEHEKTIMRTWSLKVHDDRTGSDREDEMLDACFDRNEKLKWLGLHSVGGHVAYGRSGLDYLNQWSETVRY